MLTRWQKVELAARDQVIAHRFGGAPAPVNPWRRETVSHIRWNMARRKAEATIDAAQAALDDLGAMVGVPLPLVLPEARP
ncbi:hypothetical protein ACFSTD_09650 [Novosphingobium colocasiae]|uniref:Uncharacterized protein n=1 Tax=Novosphingobium colocasiae TaxID=1256513 RepID=A0A918PDS9_9SPHN|nr:hypothetical protein [Novosphingobium colocasiae]GGZ02486.1 hypothetical protein GCM10011614_16940 [Novosphingobium colocasiae]